MFSGGAEIRRSVQNFCGQKEERGEMDAGCCSKPEMTFLEDQSQDKQKVIRKKIKCVLLLVQSVKK